jgi:hypothetical protein
VVPVENAETVSGRAEDLPIEGFDSATSRGLKVDGAMAASLLRPAGDLFLWTTKVCAAENPLLSARFRLRQTLPIPGTGQRVIALFRRD